MSFFFSSRRRHTRYWRDWSSDVCSSDLLVLAGQVDLIGQRDHVAQLFLGQQAIEVGPSGNSQVIGAAAGLLALRGKRPAVPVGPGPLRSEERRVGKECRSRSEAYE